MSKASEGARSPGVKISCEMPRREPAGDSCRDLKVSLTRRWRRQAQGGTEREEEEEEEVEEDFEPLMHVTTVVPRTSSQFVHGC